MLVTVAVELTCMADASPSVLFGWISLTASVILGASLGLAGTPDVLGEVYVVSAAGSDDTILTVITVAEPTAAFNLALYSTVSLVYPELLEVSFNNVVYPVPRSWNPFARPFVVSVSPDPDLVVASAPMSRLPVAVVVSSSNTTSLLPAMPVTQVGSSLILPPALKKCLMVSADANVTEISIVDVEFQVAEFVTVVSAFVVKAVAFGEPAATDAASVAKSVSRAALIAMVSPVATAAVEVRVSLV